jgi:hypothetical protein
MMLGEQPIAPRPLEREDEVRKALEEALVGLDRGGEVALDGLAHRPSPLGVEVRERDDVEPGASHGVAAF